MFKLVKNLCHPVTPKSKTYAELKALLIQHYTPKLIVITKCYKF